MPKTKKILPKRPRRPVTGRDPVTAIRLEPEMRARLDAWAKANAVKSRSGAIRNLIELGLNAAYPGAIAEIPNPVAQPAKPARKR
jgi:hypothetical protein